MVSRVEVGDESRGKVGSSPTRKSAGADTAEQGARAGKLETSNSLYVFEIILKINLPYELLDKRLNSREEEAP